MGFNEVCGPSIFGKIAKLERVLSQEPDKPEKLGIIYKIHFGTCG